ncbi:MAG: hypothetical protein LIP15_14255, partial [Clostridium sp.]|nr:hypothetical protein [Clostridium sp.]
LYIIISIYAISQGNPKERPLFFTGNQRFALLSGSPCELIIGHIQKRETDTSELSRGGMGHVIKK